MVECCVIVFFKQKTAYEMRISDWSSDVCSSDLPRHEGAEHVAAQRQLAELGRRTVGDDVAGLHHVTDLHQRPLGDAGVLVRALEQIGRASCRERVCQYV